MSSSVKMLNLNKTTTFNGAIFFSVLHNTNFKFCFHVKKKTVLYLNLSSSNYKQFLSLFKIASENYQEFQILFKLTIDTVQTCVY